MVNHQGIGDRRYTPFFELVHRPCIFVPRIVLWQGGFPFEPKQFVGATVSPVNVFLSLAVNALLILAVNVLLCFAVNVLLCLSLKVLLSFCRFSPKLCRKCPPKLCCKCPLKLCYKCSPKLYRFSLRVKTTLSVSFFWYSFPLVHLLDFLTFVLIRISQLTIVSQSFFCFCVTGVSLQTVLLDQFGNAQFQAKTV